ncbi:hypothetical protein JCM31739_04120 [Faecalimonas canis]
MELIPSIPIFANIDVSAANIADSNANTNHILYHLDKSLNLLVIYRNYIIKEKHCLVKKIEV